MNPVPGPTANPPDAAHPAAAFAATLDTLLASILAMLGAKFRHLGPFTGPLWTRFSRARVRLVRLLTTLATGRYRPTPPRAPRPGQNGGTPAAYSPRGRLWLVRKLGYHAAGYGSQLNFLLQDPNTQALLATAPPQALASLGRTLRPLCHLLGVDLPAPLQSPLRPRKPRKPRKPRARPAQPHPKPPVIPRVIPPWGLAPPEPEPPPRPFGTDTAGFEFDFEPA